MSLCQAITIRWAEQGDQHKWDVYVKGHPNSSPYHLFAWKQAIEQAYGHKSYYLYAETSDNLVGVLPLFHLYFPGIVNEIVALPYCDVGNCLCDQDTIQDTLLSEALRLQRKFHCRKLHLRGPLRGTEMVAQRFQIEKTGKVRMLLDIPNNSDELFVGFNSKLRSQIRKAEKNGILFRWGNIEEIESAYSVFSTNMHKLGSPVHAKGLFFSILDNYKGNGRIGLVEFKDKVIGMAVILLNEQRVSIPWASVLHDYNYLAPNMLMYWNILKFSTNHGCKLFDFGRSTEGEGTFNFKKQWGAKPVPLQWFSATLSMPKANGQQKQLNKKGILVNFWKKIPLPCANFFGPRLRKYISL